MNKSNKHEVHAHYNAVAENYHEQYMREYLQDPSREYPANYFRLQLLLNAFISKNVKRVIEIGVGDGTPLSTLGRAGLDVWGFDVAQEMVKKSKLTMQAHGLDPDKIFLGDIQDPITYVHAVKEGQFDALLAMGVMPHVRNDDMVMQNMATLVKPGGKVFIEFRNKLFSLFTFNRNTFEFIMDDLLAGVSPKLKSHVEKDLKSRLQMDKPPMRVGADDSNAPGYDEILAKFHNPFEMERLFESNGFSDVKLLWYHYHPAMPYLQEKDVGLYRSEAINLEHDSVGWRGYFLCSAFVVEAIKK